MISILSAEINVFSIILVVALCLGLLFILVDAIRGIIKNAKKIKENKLNKKNKVNDTEPNDTDTQDITSSQDDEINN